MTAHMQTNLGATHAPPKPKALAVRTAKGTAITAGMLALSVVLLCVGYGVMAWAVTR